MSMPTSARRWAVRGSAAAVFLMVAGTGTQALASTQMGPPRMATTGRPVTNPYSPAYHHPYRHGVVPTIGRAQQMRTWVSQHAATIHANDLNYGGAIDGIGVTTGQEQVYLVFYGSQWGTASTDSNGDVNLSGDPAKIAPYLQEFLKGLGTGNELWSGVMTQYCQGVALNAQTCPASNTQHVAYPSGGVLAGVWVDESSASPAQATAFQLGTEAVAAAAHFSNTTAASNRDAQYVIVSPTGTDPDGYKNNFCAWHDYNVDVGVSSTYGDIAFTNLPYITDVGASCGADFVNKTTGALDGLSIVEGHEYAETITDQNPAGGWTDSGGNETGDKCAWLMPGQSGGAFNLKTSTGTFAVQTTWANDGSSGAGACESHHPVAINGGDTITVTSPGSQSTKKGTKVKLQIHASDNSLGQTLTYHASGLPKGLSIKSSTGLISGTPTTLGTRTVTVKVTDTTGASKSVTFSWKIHT
jgi:putative Ig domain-containing protein